MDSSHERASRARLSSFYFAYFLALGAFSPYFSPHLQSRGLDAGQISIVMSLWYGTRLFAPPLWAYGMSRGGRAQTWLRMGCALTLACLALFLWPLSLPGLILVMLLFATFYNAVMPQFEAITLDQLGTRRNNYGRIRLWGSIGFLLANLGYGQLVELRGYAELVWMMLPAFALLLWAALLNRVDDRPVRPPSTVGPAASSALDHQVRWLLLIAFLNQVCHGAFYVYFSLYLSEHQWSATAIGGAWAIGVLAEVLMFLLMPQTLRRCDPRWIIAVSLLAGAVRWVVLAQHPDSIGVVIGTQILHALTFAAFHGSIMSLISSDHRGADLARIQSWLYGFSSGGGGFIGSLLAGWVWLHVSHGAAFALAGLLSLLTLPLLLRLHPGSRKTAHGH